MLSERGNVKLVPNDGLFSTGKTQLSLKSTEKLPLISVDLDQTPNRDDISHCVIMPSFVTKRNYANLPLAFFKPDCHACCLQI